MHSHHSPLFTFHCFISGSTSNFITLQLKTRKKLLTMSDQVRRKEKYGIVQYYRVPKYMRNRSPHKNLRSSSSYSTVYQQQYNFHTIASGARTHAPLLSHISAP